MEFPLEPDAVTLVDGQLRVELGNGVRLTTSAPNWIKTIIWAKMQLVIDVEENPPNAKPDATSVE